MVPSPAEPLERLLEVGRLVVLQLLGGGVPFCPICVELSLKTRLVRLRALSLSLLGAVSYFRLDGQRIGCMGVGCVVAHA